MLRPTSIVSVALGLMVSGCATTGTQRCRSSPLGTCEETSAASALVVLGALAVGAGIYALVAENQRKLARTAHAGSVPAAGQVGDQINRETRWPDSGAAVADVTLASPEPVIDAPAPPHARISYVGDDPVPSAPEFFPRWRFAPGVCRSSGP